MNVIFYLGGESLLLRLTALEGTGPGDLGAHQVVVWLEDPAELTIHYPEVHHRDPRDKLQPTELLRDIYALLGGAPAADRITTREVDFAT